MDDIGHAGEPPGTLSPSLPRTNPRYLMERQNIKRCRAGANYLPEHGCSLSTLNIQWLGHVHQMKDDNICHVRRTGHSTPETHRYLPRQLGTTCSDRNGWRYVARKRGEDGKEIELNH